MIANIINKFIALILAFLMSIGIISPAPIPSDGIDASVELAFANDEVASAAGTLTVTSNYDAEYSVFWGNIKGEKLVTYSESGATVPYTEFASVTVKDGKGEKELNPFLAIPQNATSMLLYYEDQLVDTEALPLSKTFAYGIKTYSFGSLSDIHFNRYYDDAGNDISDTSYPRALNFLDDMGVSIVGASGDLSKEGEDSAYISFNKYNSQHNFKVFTCKGNHDCKSKFNYETWKDNVNIGVFSDEKPAGVLNVSDNGYDFVYSGKETHGDVFIFFSQITDKYAPFVQLVTDEQLDWLETQLETYKDKRVYLYFHTFLNAPSGNPFLGEGNIFNDYGLFYTLPYFKGNKDEKRFRGLMTEYKNVIYFNGHSHWTYAMEEYNKNLNITDYDGTTATMVHISSSSAPRTTSITQPIQHSNPGTMSEGLYLNVYPNFVISNACDFVNGQILAYATYKIDK